MIYDVLIIGGGCSGISAAIYAAGRGRKTLLIEQESQVGGEIRQISAVTHFAGAFNNESGPALAKRMGEQLQKYDVPLVHSKVVSARLENSKKVIETSVGEFCAKNVIIAAGTSQKELNNLDKNFSRSVSHCAYRDAGQYAEKTVFVIGGSDGAAKEALYLAGIVKNVIMIVLEPKLNAIPQFSERINETSNIQVITDSSIKQISGTNSIEVIEIVHNNTKEITSLEAVGSGIFVYIGSIPNTDWCKGLQLDNGYIVTDETMQTNLPNVFAAGDIRAKTVRQISTAVSDGTIAAIYASSSLV